MYLLLSLGVKPTKWQKKRENVKKVAREEKKKELLQKRKDFGLKHAIINEKPDEKFTKYLVSQIPYQFGDDKELYEKSLRAPIGKEWNSIGSFQTMIAPKVETRSGAIIDPIEEVKQKEDDGDPEKRLGEKQRSKQKAAFARKAKKKGAKSR
jgi:U3 small nucleolar RNA-associated protein 14